VQTQTELAEENILLRQENAYLKEELAQLKRLIYGSKKERFIVPDTAQKTLFDPGDPETVEVEILKQ
jgi:hypothetical protein